MANDATSENAREAAKFHGHAHTSDYVEQALDWCQSEAHAMKMVAALRSRINHRRAHIAELQEGIDDSMAALNAVRNRAYEEGWNVE